MCLKLTSLYSVNNPTDQVSFSTERLPKQTWIKNWIKNLAPRMFKSLYFDLWGPILEPDLKSSRYSYILNKKWPL